VPSSMMWPSSLHHTVAHAIDLKPADVTGDQTVQERPASAPLMRYLTIGVRSYSVLAFRIAYSCSTVLKTSTVL
jgi:hypothetical protein